MHGHDPQGEYDFEAQGWCPRCQRMTDCLFYTCSCCPTGTPKGVCTECPGDPNGTPEVVFGDEAVLAR